MSSIGINNNQIPKINSTSPVYLIPVNEKAQPAVAINKKAEDLLEATKMEKGSVPTESVKFNWNTFLEGASHPVSIISGGIAAGVTGALVNKGVGALALIGTAAAFGLGKVAIENNKNKVVTVKPADVPAKPVGAKPQTIESEKVATGNKHTLTKLGAAVGLATGAVVGLTTKSFSNFVYAASVPTVVGMLLDGISSR